MTTVTGHVVALLTCCTQVGVALHVTRDRAQHDKSRYQMAAPLRAPLPTQDPHFLDGMS
jgi:hypothetical protein